MAALITILIFQQLELVQLATIAGIEIS